MKINYIYTILKGLVAATVLTGMLACTHNFEGYNKLDDEPSPEQIPSPIRNGLAIQGMTYAVVPVVKNRYQVMENMLGGAYGRYFAYGQGINWPQVFAFYNPKEEWHNAIFNNAMTDIYSNWSKVREITGGQGLSYAWAQIVRIAAMHRLTDTFGPIPYSKMGESGGIVTEYDSQEQVYMAMFADLDTAINDISGIIATNPDDRSMKEYDYVYFGDFTKWLKFANSLKLRMAMRISFVNPTLAEQKAKEALAHTYGVILSNDDSAQITVSQTGDQSPLWWCVVSYEDSMSAAEIVNYMKSFSDPRLEKYFLRTGNSSASAPEYSGIRVSAESAKEWHPQYSKPVTDKANDKVMWMSASEVAFLKAEMALNGWYTDASAQSLYEEGIRLSFAQWGADNLTDYLADASSVPQNYIDPRGDLTYRPAQPYTVTIAWDEGADKEVKLEKIITQKWIATYPLGTEAWCEQRRTGYPRFYPTLSNKSEEAGLDKVGASRLTYPPSEVRRNPEHYKAAVLLLGGADLHATKLWWDVKTDKPAW
ncbi:SusD/RagB family nutrient-binding outer membrane lipoprotein [uncultured Alistipes sp.]|jgi:hypothetical protein|uniref:SusD/RagB family nutrient-binding outer membrane lipoprotein n=1 Tax=uncultured Alistipes sp. TaxID=538949 RepID=UPI0025EC20E9|nr:SusD/RagB family nutrient-binding outer membrane lipoprotein [uncultured Alistipes sp.]